MSNRGIRLSVVGAPLVLSGAGEFVQFVMQALRIAELF